MFDQPTNAGTEVVEVSPMAAAVRRDAPMVATEVVDVLPALTAMEDSFCLAVIEYNGNLSAAYKSVFGDVARPLASARGLMQRPEIIARVKSLTETVQEAVLVSMASHVTELADIRDLAKVQGNLKVALGAERARGEVAGLYIGKIGNAPGKPADVNVGVIVHVATPQDGAI
jgi:hypothetical protein